MLFQHDSPSSGGTDFFNKSPSQMSTTAKVFSVSDLPPFLAGNQHSGNRRIEIKTYLRKLALTNRSCSGNCFLLPSLVSLETVFNAPQQEVYEALRDLRKEGYDSFIPGLYGNISLWDQQAPAIPNVIPL